MKDYYVILQVARSASMNDIKQAYKNFALKLHPDVTGNNEEKTRIFKQLTEAYNILSNSERRKKYDSSLGISRVSGFYTGQAGADAGGAGRHHHPYPGGGGGGDVRAPPPPPGFKTFDHEEWNAWHYGDNAYQSDPIKIRNSFMDIRPDEKGAQYFIRQKTKETQGITDQTYKRGKQERDMIVERMKARRSRRMAGQGYDNDAASGSSCVIS